MSWQLSTILEECVCLQVSVASISNNIDIFDFIDRCDKLIKLARKYNLLVVTDDVYNLLYFGDSPPTRLYQFDKK